MTKFMGRRGRREDGEDISQEAAKSDGDVGEEREEEVEEVEVEVEEVEEPMLSRQRRFISDMFSYLTGDSEAEPEPEQTADYSHHSQPEPSYPVKPNQHRHHRSPHPEPGAEGMLASLVSIFSLNFLFNLQVPILLSCMRVPGTWAMITTSLKIMRAATIQIKLIIIFAREAAWTNYQKRNLSFTSSPD